MYGDRSFGRWLKQRRKVLDLTQDELARRVGCAVITIKKFEAEERRPSRQIVERLLEILAIPPEEHSAFIHLARAAPHTVQPARPQKTPQFVPDECGAEDDLGRAIKGYELREHIGTGSLGAVYRAHQSLLGRDVAIKIILPQYANHPDFIRHFEADAQLVARLEHPHIVPLYDYWREPDRAYLVMRWVPGGSVRAVLQRGPLALDATARLLSQVGAALTVAHRYGVVHQNVKPANMLLDEAGNAYLADFGIATDLGAALLVDQIHPDGVGARAYLAPEQIRAEPVTPRTDIYSLGVLLYELLAGAPPFSTLPLAELLQKQLHEPLPTLRRPDLPDGINAIIRQATAKRPAERYPDVPCLVADFQRAVAPGSGPWSVVRRQWTIGDELQTTDHRPWTTDNPYKGLRAFGEADTADFFGRETLVARLLERLAEATPLTPLLPLPAAGEGELGCRLVVGEGANSSPSPLVWEGLGGWGTRFLAVVGPSGSGKSSVVRAGLLPALRRGGLPGSEHWFVAEMVPSAHPLAELETALLRVAVNSYPDMLEQLQADERGLLRAVERVLPPDEEVELVLVIDQFEEVFTLVEDQATRTHLLNSLVVAVLDERSRLRVVVTLRADFMDRPLQYVDFGELVRRRSEFVLPLTTDALERAIAGPAERNGLALEPGLVATIIHDMGEQPGALPLLQYALTELFERREGHSLTLRAYRESSGVLGALARRADELYEGLDFAGQEAARQLFLRLVTLGKGVEDTRRRVRRSELLTMKSTKDVNEYNPDFRGLRDLRDLRGFENDNRAMDAVIDLYGRYRLLTFDCDPVTRGPTVEVAHEALLRMWERLRAWLDASREDLRVQRRLLATAAEWASAGCDSSFLAMGARLAQFEALIDSDLALNAEERAYLDASLAAREAQWAREEAARQHELDQAQALAAEQQRRAEAERQRAEEQASANRRLRRRAALLAAATLIAVVAAAVAGFQRQRATVQATRAIEAQATAEAERGRAEHEARIARARELAAAAVSNLATDPEIGILLALHAVSATYSVDKTVIPEAENALHQAVQASRLRLTLSGHTDAVDDVAFSLDGRRLVTVSDDQTAKGWDAASGKQLLTLTVYTHHTKYLLRLALSRDGTRLATVGDDQAVKVWDVASGKRVLTLIGHTDVVQDVAFSPDGARLATASLDGTAKFWDAQSGKPLLTLTGHTDLVESVAFSPDGRRLATASDDQTAKVWDLASGRMLLTLSGHTGEVYAVAFSPDGRRLATAGYDRTARVWDAASGVELLTLSGHTDVIPGIAFSPDGRWLATASFDGTAKVWDAASGVELLTLSGPTSRFAAVAFSPDGRRLATASIVGTAQVWDVAPGHTKGLAWLAFSPDGRRLATASLDGTAKVWDALSGQELSTLAGHSDSLRVVGFSPDGWRLVTADRAGTAKVWDATSGKLLHTLTGHTRGIENIAFSPDGRRLATASVDGTARVWDISTSLTAGAATGQELLTLRHADQVIAVAFSPDGRRLATVSLDGTAKVWDAATGQELLTLRHTAGVIAVAFSPDGTRLATGSFDRTAKVWDAASGRELLTLAGHTKELIRISFSPDGRRLATVSLDGTAKVWDAATGQELLTLTGHTNWIWYVVFSPDGRRLATASGDKTARVWDAVSGQELLTLPHTSEVAVVAFSPDGRRLATAAKGERAPRIYLLNIEDLLALAHSRVTRSLTAAECQKYIHMEQCPPTP